jgi:hypothetical protein
VPNRKLLSNAIKQGAYATNPQGEGIEKAERATRRALLLALIAHANTGVPANDRATGIAACKDHPGDKRGLLNAELSDLERAIRQIKARGSIAKCADCADTWRDWDGTRQNPLLAGSAIGQRGTNGPGTLGCFVRYKGEIFILSNMHVLKKTGVTDTAILHPPHLLGGTFYDEIATYCEGDPGLDAALARVKPGVRCENRTPEGNVIVGFNSDFNVYDQVFKYGVATGGRSGEILGLNPELIRCTDFGPKVVTMDPWYQILVQQSENDDSDGSKYAFQVPGDSGSIVINREGQVVALMHGQVPGNVAVGQATTIDGILDRWPTMEILGPGVHVAP